MKLAAIKIISIIALWISVILLTLILSNPKSPISFPYWLSSKAISFVPQGWGFFTRNPREKIFDGYSLTNGKLKSVFEHPISIANDFGANRKQRIIFSELSQLIKQVPDSCWIELKGDIRHVVPSKKSPIKVRNSFSTKYLRGIMYLQVLDVIPWAWAKTIRKNKIKRTFKYTVVDIS